MCRKVNAPMDPDDFAFFHNDGAAGTGGRGI